MHTSPHSTLRQHTERVHQESREREHHAAHRDITEGVHIERADSTELLGGLVCSPIVPTFVVAPEFHLVAPAADDEFSVSDCSE